MHGHVSKWTFVGYFLCSKYPTITPKVPNNQLWNKGHLLFLLFRSTQQVSSGLLGLMDGQNHGRTHGMTKTIYPLTYFVCQGYNNIEETTEGPCMAFILQSSLGHEYETIIFSS